VSKTLQNYYDTGYSAPIENPSPEALNRQIQDCIRLILENRQKQHPDGSLKITSVSTVLLTCQDRQYESLPVRRLFVTVVIEEVA
jgi:hypothetical protein